MPAGVPEPCRVLIVQAARAIRKEQPDVQILLLTGTTTRKAAIAGVFAGASGLLFKGGPPREVIAAILGLGIGQAGPGHDEMHAIRAVLLGETDQAVDLLPRDILRLVLNGATDGAIMEQLRVSADEVQAVVWRELVAHGIVRAGSHDRHF